MHVYGPRAVGLREWTGLLFLERLAWKGLPAGRELGEPAGTQLNVGICQPFATDAPRGRKTIKTGRHSVHAQLEHWDCQKVCCRPCGPTANPIVGLFG